MTPGFEPTKTLRLIVRTGTTTPGLYVPGTTLLDHNASPAKISPAIYSQQRSLARCGAVRYGAVPFAAVLCRAALCAFFRT